MTLWCRAEWPEVKCIYLRIIPNQDFRGDVSCAWPKRFESSASACERLLAVANDEWPNTDGGGSRSCLVLLHASARQSHWTFWQSSFDGEMIRPTHMPLFCHRKRPLNCNYLLGRREYSLYGDMRPAGLSLSSLLLVQQIHRFTIKKLQLVPQYFKVRSGQRCSLRRAHALIQFFSLQQEFTHKGHEGHTRPGIH
jgi:hypothetical protein